MGNMKMNIQDTRHRARGPKESPTSNRVKSARELLGLTQEDAAEVVNSTSSAWQSWEYGTRKMHPGLWELFCLKTGLPYP